ncbi:hypothetical protein [Paenarthrobacter sp. NPDC018779]|uniref:hypothetical protein n=1 Tax=Paenarthrobacter sp. NPDC018779 TaxID=3364375 RepID=UPI0037C83688
MLDSNDSFNTSVMDGANTIRLADFRGPSMGRRPLTTASGRHSLPRTRRLPLGLVCFAAWSASVATGQFMDAGPEIHRIGLAVHVLALVLAFGTILVVDWLGLLWILGKVALHEPGKLESVARPLIWGGIALLLASGATIKPDLGNPATCVKLVSVLVLMLNGLGVSPAMHKLMSLPPQTRLGGLGRRLRARIMIAAAVSQGCWWTAVLVGLINSTVRRWAGQ